MDKMQIEKEFKKIFENNKKNEIKYVEEVKFFKFFVMHLPKINRLSYFLLFFRVILKLMNTRV